MLGKISTPLLSTSALITAILTGGALPAMSQDIAKPVEKPTFICVEEANPPMTLAYDPESNDYKPVMSWYKDYLLAGESATEVCQSVADKLQERYDAQQPSFLAYQKIQDQDRWEICVAPEEGQECSATGSEVLFSLNSEFKSPTECVMMQTEPTNCAPNIRTRGTVLSVPSKRYWFFSRF